MNAFRTPHIRTLLVILFIIVTGLHIADALDFHESEAKIPGVSQDIPGLFQVKWDAPQGFPPSM